MYERWKVVSGMNKNIQKNSMEEIRTILQQTLSGAIAVEDNEMIARASRALSAFDAPVDIEIFSQDYYDRLFDDCRKKILERVDSGE